MTTRRASRPTSPSSPFPTSRRSTASTARSSTGAIGQRVTITPDDAALAEAGLTSQAISDALKQNGVLLPAGSITENDLTLTVQSGAKLDSVDAIAALPLVPTDPAGFASGIKTIGDVATVAGDG